MSRTSCLLRWEWELIKDDDMDSEEIVEKICKAHAEYCSSRKNKPCGYAGQTVQNLFSASKCCGCPYYTEYSCVVKFAVEHLRKSQHLEKTTDS